MVAEEKELSNTKVINKKVIGDDLQSQVGNSEENTMASTFSITDSMIQRCNNRALKISSVEEECKAQWECGKTLGITTDNNEEDIVKEFINLEQRDKEALKGK